MSDPPQALKIHRRAGGRAVVGIESTVFVHGLPREEALPLAEELTAAASKAGVTLAIIGVLAGKVIVGLTQDDLCKLIAERAVKLNTSNLGLAIHQQLYGATTVSTTLEIAARAGLRLVATGGLGGVHRGFGQRLDISADLAALARWPVAIVCSGVKSILDIESTREAMETMGVPVVGVGTDEFPAFMVRSSGLPVDGRIDDPAELAVFVERELARSPRGIVLANPVPEADAIGPQTFSDWMAAVDSQRSQAGSMGREETPMLLEGLRHVSDGRSLRANLALIRDNTRLAIEIARCMHWV